MNKNLVVKDNALINASYNLELVEQRLILLAVVEARRTNQEIKSDDFLTICAENYINEFGVHRNVAYQALKDACSHLFERRFTYQKLTPKVIRRRLRAVGFKASPMWKTRRLLG
ncbi:Protein involved in initiation of plasmid replication [Moraxella lacunata]|uniref:Protein involved in initiation of plasmid replication n=1 Tax=Moraxella lacunata TaxID=477 RepID=A0A378UEU5_MORLA|nr:RepB family plasmid replication initiator protein [Moraxella lacunata]STZ74902.1 Protein involved in initiation of plasmid replication [Moraxella lacunata]